ncbi:DUF2254 domain-containing protein [Maritalea sp.]|uniref:DUF2254 domain-containing protein n=1 Tax=Maritalea sp. TaxID=2003361 RepID=UPI003EF13794
MTQISRFLKNQARNIRGLNTVPGLIAMGLWGMSLLCLWVDHSFPEFSSSQPFRVLYTDYDTAKTILSTVAAASITTLGLVYSIVLVVFTTAAGNIGPRLLQRFTSDPVNQVTAGLFGGTFLFALTVLHQTDTVFVPSFSITVTFLLAGLFVLQLIYFVHKASTSVTIDEEVAEIADRLERDIARLVDDEEGRDSYKSEPPDSDFEVQIETNASGYITLIDVPALVKLAKEHQLFICLAQGHGDFIVPGLLLAQLDRSLGEEEQEKVTKAILNAVVVSKSRSPDSDIEFSINLLIEIALRALSPGVNDTFTAIACVDRISAALVRPARRGMRDQYRADEDKVPRLFLPDLTLIDLIDVTFHPLRRAASSNILMAKHILNALGRLYIVGDEEACEIIKKHADLIVENVKKTEIMQTDIDFISKLHKKLF